MTVGELRDALKDVHHNKEIWISIPTMKSVNIIKDAVSTHRDAIEGAFVIECGTLNKVQGDFVK